LSLLRALHARVAERVARVRPRAAFEIAVDDSKSSRFDGRSLAEYLSAARLFQNPLSRRPLERTDCERLDAYIRKHKLGRQFHVTRDFDEAQAAAAAAAAAGTSEALAAERAAAAEALLHAFFAGASRGRDARRGGGGGGGSAAAPPPRPQHAPPALQAEGNFALMDDDVGMLRGRSRGAAEAAVVARAQTQAARLGGGGGGAVGRGSDAFPALPTPSWPTLQSAPPPRSAAAPATGATGDAGSDAARARPSWWALAAPAPAPAARVAPPSASAGGAGGEDAAASETRRRQLADAFGVSDPLTRPSMFAASAAEAFSAPTLAIARAEPAFVADLEARFDAALAARARRTALPPMPRDKRRVVHEMAHMYGCVSSSYGQGASRHVDLFVLAVSGCPSIRLSDAARAPPPPLGSEGGGDATAADGAPLQLRFSGAALEASVPRALGTFDGEYTLTWRPPNEAVATFKSEATFRAAAERLGAGLRGIFTVTASGGGGGGTSAGPKGVASSATPATAPSRAEIKRLVAARKAADAAWEDDAPRGGRAGRADEASSWESRADGGAVVTLRAVHVPTVNRWGALLGDDAAADDEDGGASGGSGGGGGASDAEEAEPVDSWDAEPEGTDAHAGDAATAAAAADTDAW
jgi:hypothetical protein